MPNNGTDAIATQAIDRYRSGEWRAVIFRDLVMSELPAKKVLDIGCGAGFDNSRKLQADIAAQCDELIGIEPDPAVDVPSYFASVHRATMEDVRLLEGSIDVAYSVMVLEHLTDPQVFWDRLYDCLVPGGVFWGFTMDARHYFCWFSQIMERLHIKDVYLSVLKGRRSVDRYANYPTYYLSNTPADVQRLARRFSRCDVFALSRPGELDGYYPRALRPLFNAIDRRVVARGNNIGYLLCVRAEK